MSADRASVELVAHPTCGNLGAAGAVTVHATATSDVLSLTYDLRSRVAMKIPGLQGERADGTLRGMRSHRWPGSIQAPKITQAGDDQSGYRLLVEVAIPRVAIGVCTEWYPTVVLETMAGISLWAIWHPVDRPHFHHPDNFSRAAKIP
jgi:hypothetical protein